MNDDVMAARFEEHRMRLRAVACPTPRFSLPPAPDVDLRRESS